MSEGISTQQSLVVPADGSTMDSIGSREHGESGWHAIPIRTTHPDELLRHDISDEELEMLGENKKSFFHEFMWAALTGAIGSGPAATHNIHSAFFATPASALTAFELIEIVIFFGFVILACFAAVAMRLEMKRAPDNLKERIRAWTKCNIAQN